jgi:hypothetical protein
MKATIALGCLLLVVSSARGQFVMLEQMRSVSARAELSRTNDPPRDGDFHLLDEPTRAASGFDPFDETVTAHVSVPSAGLEARATAWQRSTLSANEIVAAGGPQNVFSCCFGVNHSASAGSTTRVVFRLDTPTFLNVHAEILDLDDYRPLATLYTSGNVDFSLTGPNLAIVHEAKTGLFVGEPLPAVVPIVIDETHLVEPGVYELDVIADYVFAGDRTLSAGYYDVRLSATPIPEPDSLALLVLVSLFAFVGRRYVLAHFGK